jgi:5-methylcytosine-specific restriction endonuclease McrA
MEIKFIKEEGFWTDHEGKLWKVIPLCYGNNYSKVKARSKALKNFVFHRDENKCRHCGSTIWLSLDHIKPKRIGGSNHPNNLQTLCHSCNAKKVKTDLEKYPPCLMPV